jgi:hypothetical protein
MSVPNVRDTSGHEVLSIQLQVKFMNKRRHPRIPIRGLTADISDGKGFFTGSVTDISRFGMSLNHIPSDLDPDADILSVIIDGQGAHFKLLVKQKWESGNGKSKIIGGQIENSPWDWTEFVMQLEPDQDDIWG